MRFSHCEKSNCSFNATYVLYMGFNKNNYNNHDNKFVNGNIIN